MNKLMSHSQLFRENILAMIGVCLCIYFSYHAILGNRSVVKLYSLGAQIETLSQEKTAYVFTKDSLQKKVLMMRPGSVDKDLLEERARVVLGYRQSEEIVLLGN